MKVAVIGSRKLKVENLKLYLPQEIEEIISGGADGIDQCAAHYAHSHNIPLTKINPDYRHYGKAAPLKRNTVIVQLADAVIVFWDKKSRGSFFVINECIKTKKELHVYVYENESYKECFDFCT